MPSQLPTDSYELDSLDLDVIRLALRGDANMRRYVPEVIRLCGKLRLPDPPWFEENDVRERVARNRASPPPG